MRNKHYKKHKDLIKVAIKNQTKRSADKKQKIKEYWDKKLKAAKKKLLNHQTDNSPD